MYNNYNASLNYAVMSGKIHVLITITSDSGPPPSILEANTVTPMSLCSGHGDEDISNTWLHIPTMQEEAAIVNVPHIVPVTVSE